MSQAVTESENIRENTFSRRETNKRRGINERKMTLTTFKYLKIEFDWKP